LIARWCLYSEKSNNHFIPDITSREGNSSDPKVIFETQLRETVALLRNKGIEVLIMRQVPFQKRSVPENLVNATRFGRDSSTIGVTREEHLNHQKFVNTVIDSLEGPGITILDPLPYLSSNERTLIFSDGKALYRDADHLSIAGSRLLRPLFEPLFDARIHSKE